MDFSVRGGKNLSVSRVLVGAIWKSPALLKEAALSWRVFLDRIPTRDNLQRRNIICLD